MCVCIYIYTYVSIHIYIYIYIYYTYTYTYAYTSRDPESPGFHDPEYGQSLYTCIYIYIYVITLLSLLLVLLSLLSLLFCRRFPTKSLDFRGFDSSRLLILRGEIPRPIGDLPESLSQAMLVGTMLVGRLGVRSRVP